MAKIVGGKKFARHLAVRSNGVDVTRVLLAGAEDTRSEYVRSLNETSGGKTDVRYGPRRTVTVSAPGSSPNSDTGDLANSTGVKSQRRNQSEFFVSEDHASALEFGTPNMAPRPALGPSFDSLKPHILKNIVKALKDG